MQPIHTFNVVPKLPAELEPLRTMVFNLWWTWEPQARALFRHLDHELWHATNHNPLRMLQLCRQARLVEVAQDDDFLREMRAVYEKFGAYLERPDTYGKLPQGLPVLRTAPMAYFSAEFGFHESVPNYSGGLGILSGDHCKSASDLGLHFVAVTLLYKHGYFRQQINKEGWQESVQLNQNFSHLPLSDALDNEGRPLFIVGEHPRPNRRGESLEACTSAGSPFICSIPICRRTARRIGRSPRSSMAAIMRCGSSRRSCSASAASTPSARKGSSRRSFT